MSGDFTNNSDKGASSVDRSPGGSPKSGVMVLGLRKTNTIVSKSSAF